MAYLVTPNLGLPLVSDGDTAWGQAMRDAMTMLDTAGGTSASTVVLTLGATTGTVDLGLLFEIDSEIASAPGRFRLYRTTAGRDVDLPRGPATSPSMSVGLLLDDLFEAGALSIQALPAPGAPSGGSLCAWSWSGALGATVTLNVSKLR
jgi:hypothetical protein